MTGEIVGIQIPLLPLEARPVGVDVLQLPGDLPDLTCLHVSPCRRNALIGRVGLRPGGQQNDRLRQRQLRLGQTKLHGAVHTGFDDGHRHGIGQPHVLACRAQDSPAGTDQIPCLQQSRQIMQRRIGIGATHGLHQRRQNIKMRIAFPVVAHGALLACLLGIGKTHLHGAVLHGRGRTQQLHGVDTLAHVAAAALGDVIHHALFQGDLAVTLSCTQLKSAAQSFRHLGRGDLLELEDGASAQNGVVYIKIRIFGSRGDQGDLAALNELQQALLLLFVEILDLIQIEQHALRGQQSIQFGHHTLDIGGGGRGGVELHQSAVGLVGDDLSQRGFAHTGGAVKDHVGDVTAFQNTAQQAARANDVLLSHHIVQLQRPDLVCQGLIHETPPSLQ